jgi:hypothetical protein
VPWGGAAGTVPCSCCFLYVRRRNVRRRTEREEEEMEEREKKKKRKEKKRKKTYGKNFKLENF